jgi:hypothetical protein
MMAFYEIGATNGTLGRPPRIPIIELWIGAGFNTLADSENSHSPILSPLEFGLIGAIRRFLLEYIHNSPQIG